MVKTDEAELRTNTLSYSSSLNYNEHISNKSITELEETCIHLKQRFDSATNTIYDLTKVNGSSSISGGVSGPGSWDNDNDNETDTEGFLAQMIIASRKKTGDLLTKEKENRERQGEFNWTRGEQGIILGSFFWGHVFTQIPGGMLAQR